MTMIILAANVLCLIASAVLYLLTRAERRDADETFASCCRVMAAVRELRDQSGDNAAAALHHAGTAVFWADRAEQADRRVTPSVN